LRLRFFSLCLAHRGHAPAQGTWLSLANRQWRWRDRLLSEREMLWMHRLFADNDGTFLRNSCCHYNGGGPNSVALSPRCKICGIGFKLQSESQLFRVARWRRFLVERICALKWDNLRSLLSHGQLWRPAGPRWEPRSFGMCREIDFDHKRSTGVAIVPACLAVAFR